MRVLHVPYSYYPDPAAGTEIYVEGLAGIQRTLGCEAAVAAPGVRADHYEHAGIPVWRFAVEGQLDLQALYGSGDAAAAAGFARILDGFRPDIVHLHALTSAISVRLAAEVAARQIPLAFNYHTPTVSCTRGTLLRWGHEICDGKLDARVCTACTLTGKGISRPVASLLSAIPLAGGELLARAGLGGGVWTALRMRELTALRIAAFERMMELSDKIVALCHWTRELLRLNGVPDEKITVCRQGIVWDSGTPRPETGAPATPVRLAFLGRLDATKGAHIVVRALRLNPALPVELDLYGVSQGESGARYAAELRTLIGDDRRIRLQAPVPSGDVVAALRNYHALLVPSQWLETGPLVVLEAFAARIPVIGSDLGGVAELVTDGVDGMLVSPYASVEAWSEALRRICTETGLIEGLRAGVPAPRHSREAATEIMALYTGMLSDRSSPSSQSFPSQSFPSQTLPSQTLPSQTGAAR